MGRPYSLGMLLQFRRTRSLTHVISLILVDRDAHGKRWVPRHTRRGRFKSQQQHNENKRSSYLYVCFTDCQLYVDGGERRKRRNGHVLGWPPSY
jgi:hypothetical protein